MIRLFIGIMFLITTLTNCTGQDTDQLKKEPNYKDETFKVGQIWHYKTRTGEEKSTIQILKIDKYEGKEAFIHVSVKNVKMKSPSAESGIAEKIGHLPFYRTSLEQSVTKLAVQKAKLSDYKDGYKEWKEAFETGEGGVFTISISEAVSYVETAMNQ